MIQFWFAWQKVSFIQSSKSFTAATTHPPCRNNQHHRGLNYRMDTLVALVYVLGPCLCVWLADLVIRSILPYQNSTHCFALNLPYSFVVLFWPNNKSILYYNLLVIPRANVYLSINLTWWTAPHAHFMQVYIQHTQLQVSRAEWINNVYNNSL